MPEIGFSLQAQYDLPVDQVIPLLKTAGFSAVSPVWSPELELHTLAQCVQESSMRIQSLHAPHRSVTLMWQPEAPEAEAIQSNMLRCVDDCTRYDIPILVMHCWQGLFYTFPDEPLDYRFFDRLVSYAEEKGVSIALENLEGEEYLQALMNRYADRTNVGFCWDSGHDNCYPHRLDFLQEFGDQLIMTHFNDNMGMRNPCGVPSGNDDLHFMPYDGIIDWNNAMKRLQRLPRQDTLNFEIKLGSRSHAPEDEPYAGLSTREFFEKAGNRAKRIAALYDSIVKGL